jgi:fermentation-respiration switch protein FrsA (DUF1100 family)
MTTIHAVDVTFNVDDLTLAGHLRLPHPDRDTAHLPSLVFTGPFTGVKEQVAGLYAQQLSERGFVTLTFDHRNFGASGGHRRQHEDAAAKLADLGAATSFLANHPAVDADRIHPTAPKTPTTASMAPRNSSGSTPPTTSTCTTNPSTPDRRSIGSLSGWPNTCELASAGRVRQNERSGRCTRFHGGSC